MGKPRNCMLVQHNQKYVKHMLFKNAKLDLFFINAWAATDFIWIKNIIRLVLLCFGDFWMLSAWHTWEELDNERQRCWICTETHPAMIAK